MIHLYMDGNKRTAWLMANIILHRVNLSVVERDFSDHELRSQYQRGVGCALMSGNLASCLDLHKRVPGLWSQRRVSITRTLL